MIAFVFILAVMIGPAAGAEGTARARSAETSPVHVHNEATPSDARIVLDTRELWRAGAGDDGPLFGVIVQALTDERGNVYLLDKQQSTVWTFAADGRFLGTLTREGEGPGEIRRPADMALLPDGSVGICSEHSGRLRRSPIGDRTGLSARAAERQRKRRHPESVRGLVQIAVRHNRVGGHRARHNEVDGRRQGIAVGAERPRRTRAAGRHHGDL